MNTSRGDIKRSGTIVVLTLVSIVGMLGIVALAIDLGYLDVVQSQLGRSADAAALAGAWKLLDAAPLSGTSLPAGTLDLVRTSAGQYAGLNTVCNAAPALGNEDTSIGRLDYPFTGSQTMTFDNPLQFNAVSATVQRTGTRNGPVGLFFARVFGLENSGMKAQATAAFVNNFKGFRAVSETENLDILPFALDKTTWDGLLAGVGSDNWIWDKDTKTVRAGHDGILEINLYPQGTGSPGNRGTVDIGSNNNSTADISRQIRYGVSAADLAHHGGSLQLDQNGQLILNGDTGISAGVKDDLASIIGKPRIIPIFTTVVGPGNNAQYTIVQFAGIRIMEVVLTGSMKTKRVTIQPAPVITPGAIPGTGNPKSNFIYSPVWLVR